MPVAKEPVVRILKHGLSHRLQKGAAGSISTKGKYISRFKIRKCVPS
jgi:hypothetical protein